MGPRGGVDASEIAEEERTAIVEGEDGGGCDGGVIGGEDTGTGIEGSIEGAIGVEAGDLIPGSAGD